MRMKTQNDVQSDVRIPGDVSAWYHAQFLKPTLFGRLLTIFFGNALRDPKIFDVLKPRPAYRFAAIDAWRRTMWHPGGLSRRTREAIAVSVSVANQCHY
jgi:alkylhydroperoxidase/carboxymuconolactone decarboxylase family protein YurZ